MNLFLSLHILAYSPAFCAPWLHAGGSAASSLCTDNESRVICLHPWRNGMPWLNFRSCCRTAAAVRPYATWKTSVRHVGNARTPTAVRFPESSSCTV